MAAGTRSRTQPREAGLGVGTSPRSMNPSEVAQVAYELFERRGRVHGRDQADWFEAERIVRRRSDDGRP